MVMDETHETDVAVIGAGYVGLTTSLALAYVGHRVSCLDVDAGKIAELQEGRAPIHEPFTDEMLAITKGRLRFITDPIDAIRTAEVIFVAVNTPSGADGRANLDYVKSAADAIGKHLCRDRVVVVNKSTVPIGSANLVEDVIRHSFAAHRGGKLNGGVSVVSNPEFLREGSAIHDSLYPDRVVLGSSNDEPFDVLTRLYKPILEQSFDEPQFLPRPASVTEVPLVRTTVVSAELIKYAANAFLATKISFANELALLAEQSGADIADVVRGVGLDHRIGPAFLRAGLGWGGSCFGKDTAALAATAREYGVCMPITEAARQVNARQRELAISKLQRELKILKGRTIGLLGISFKPHTDDLRDSPALDVASRLLDLGVRVRAHDPQALGRARRELSDMPLDLCHSSEELADEADALLLATEWPQYRMLAWRDLAQRMRRPLIVDGRNFLDRGTIEHAGFRYVGFGR
jgi:UDPglucose 6-dehydrogenase